MKELSLALILVLLVGSFAQAVPYPYRGYTIPDGDAEVVEDAIKEAHTVSAGAEIRSPPLVPIIPVSSGFYNKMTRNNSEIWIKPLTLKL